MSDYAIVDIPSESDRGRKSNKYGELAKAIRALPDGKAVELQIPEDQNPTYFGSKVAQAFRVGRNKPPIAYSVDSKRRVMRIWLRKNGNRVDRSIAEAEQAVAKVTTEQQLKRA